MNNLFYFCKMIFKKIEEYYTKLNTWYIKHGLIMFNVYIIPCIKGTINNKYFFNSFKRKSTICRYRFKTRNEFIKEFGSNWRDVVYYNFRYNMDFLLGEDFIYNESRIENGSIKFEYIDNEQINYIDLYISHDMLIKNECNMFKKLYLENKNVYE